MDSAIATLLGAAIGAAAGGAGAMLTAWRQTRLEHVKSELSVWVGFRNDVLKEMWTVHRAVVDAMTNVILRTQQAEEAGKIADIRTDITTYRHGVHRSIHLLTPQAVVLVQQFLETAYAITDSRKPPDDANALKAIRREFYEHMTAHFHLEDALPWMIREASPDQYKA